MSAIWRESFSRLCSHGLKTTRDTTRPVLLVRPYLYICSYAFEEILKGWIIQELTRIFPNNNSNPHNEIYNIAVCKILMLHWFVYAWLYFLRVSRYFFHLLKNIDTKIFVTHKFAIYHLFTNYFACLYFTFLYSTFQTCNYCYSAFLLAYSIWPKETKEMFVVYMY